MDSAQSVHTGDVPTRLLDELTRVTDDQHRRYRLKSQMRVQAGEDYVGYVRAILSDHPPAPRRFADYDLRFFDDLAGMRDAIQDREREVGLARMVAGFAWPWVSRKDKSAYDIQVDGVQLRWNVEDVDWVSSPTSAQEVGVIHKRPRFDPPLLFESRRMSSMPKKIDPMVKERCVRQVLEHLPEYSSLTAAAEVVARREGAGQGDGRRWVLQAQIDGGQRQGATSEELAEIKDAQGQGAPARGGQRDPAQGLDFLRGGTRPPQPLIVGVHRRDEGRGPRGRVGLSGPAQAGLSDRRADLP